MLKMTENPIYTEHLRQMIECRTVSAEEHFSQAEFDRFDALLRKNYPVLFEKCEIIPNGNSTFLRIPGKSEKSPLVLMSHKDVVHEGKAEKWKAPAFDGRVINGRMYGRGTFDCKGSLCCIFEAVEVLLKENTDFSADIYILSTSNEEVGGSDAPDAVEYFRSRGIIPGLVLDEGGAVLKNPFPSKKKHFAMIGAVERSSSRMIFDCPSKENAEKLQKEIKKLKAGSYEITPEVSELAEGLSKMLYFPLGSLAGILAKHKKAGAAVLTHAGPDARAFCGASFGYSKLGEYDIKVLEKEHGKLRNPVKLFISGNYYNRLEGLVSYVKELAEKYGAKLISSTEREADPPVKSTSAGFKFTEAVTEKCFGDSAALPYPVLGRTDARYFVGFADNVIRCVPVEISLSQIMKFHCPNENIFVNSLPAAVEFYKEVCREYGNSGLCR